jgi:hypothetical protein
MNQHPLDREREVKRLERWMNDLVSVLALPAVWSGSEPGRILETFLDALLEMVDLDFLYGWVTIDAHRPPTNVLITSETNVTSDSREEIRQALDRRFEAGTQRWSGDVSINL